MRLCEGLVRFSDGCLGKGEGKVGRGMPQGEGKGKKRKFPPPCFYFTRPTIRLFSERSLGVGDR